MQAQSKVRQLVIHPIIDAELSLTFTTFEAKIICRRSNGLRRTDVDAAVFNLKAVHPNAVVKVDTRTAAEVIEEHGRMETSTLGRLRALLST